MSEVSETPHLDWAIKEHNEWIEVDNTASKLCNKLGSLVIKHVKFPKKVGDKKITSKSFEPNGDFVTVNSSFLGPQINKKLSPTELVCETVSKKEKLIVRITSNVYPFNKWGGKKEQRPSAFTVTIEPLGWHFGLNANAECSAKVKTKGDEKSRDANLNQIKTLKEILTLIENPAKTKYTPSPYYFV